MECKKCGKVFIRNRKWQKFCSDKCAIKFRNGGHTIKLCEYCKHKYKGRKTQKYCSKKCHSSALVKFKICPICNNKFSPSHKVNVYCSRKCSSENKSIKNRVNTVCNNCGKEIIRPKSQIKNLNFCSRVCMGKYYSENFFGERHHLWGGGKIDGRGYNWRKIRKEVLKRDNKSCKICGVSPENTTTLDVHHIIKYRDFDNSKDANNLTNLILVCKKCHTKVFTNKGQ